MIVGAGGVAVLAHPFAREVVEPSVFQDLRRAGLSGIEVDHPDHHIDDREALRAIADDLGLLGTGSSDYHGTNKKLSIAQETTSEEMFERLVGQASGVEVLTG